MTAKKPSLRTQLEWTLESLAIFRKRLGDAPSNAQALDHLDELIATRDRAMFEREIFLGLIREALVLLHHRKDDPEVNRYLSSVQAIEFERVREIAARWPRVSFEDERIDLRITQERQFLRKLSRGRKRIDFIRSIQFSKSWGTANSCYEIAVGLVINLNSDEFKYTEGYIRAEGRLLQHAWIETERYIIDPFFALKLAQASGIMDPPVYLPVASYSRSNIGARFAEAESTGKTTVSLPFAPLESLRKPRK
jgi:hypothetical protein